MPVLTAYGDSSSAEGLWVEPPRKQESTLLKCPRANHSYTSSSEVWSVAQPHLTSDPPVEKSTGITLYVYHLRYGVAYEFRIHRHSYISMQPLQGVMVTVDKMM